MIGAPLTLEVVACTRVNRKPAAWAMARKLASSAGFRSSHESSTRVAAKVPADGDEEQWRAIVASDLAPEGSCSRHERVVRVGGCARV